MKDVLPELEGSPMIQAILSLFVDIKNGPGLVSSRLYTPSTATESTDRPTTLKRIDKPKIDVILFVWQAVCSSHTRIRLLLASSRTAICKDPRDKIHAVLGMARLENKALVDSIRPNYSSSVEEVYANFTINLMKYSKNLDILLDCNNDRSRNFRPTWSPNWAKPSEVSEFENPQYADAHTAARAPAMNAQMVLKVDGCISATVISVFSTGIRRFSTDVDIIELLGQLVHYLISEELDYEAKVWSQVAGILLRI